MSDIFDVIVKEAGDFYKQVVAVAISFLGGTLILSDKIAASPAQCLWVLVLGWAFLVIAIGIIIIIRWQNIVSGTLALRNKTEQAQKRDKIKEAFTAIASIALVLGILAIAVFGAINIHYKNSQGDLMETKVQRKDSIPFSEVTVKKTTKQGSELKKSIPFGSVVNQPAPTPGTTTTTTTTVTKKK